MTTIRQESGIQTIVILSIILSLAGFILSEVFLSTETFQLISLHIFLETLGLFSGITLAAFILFMSRTRNVISYQVWVASALIAMGILDGFHCIVPAGTSAGWLHSLAMFLGGLLFSAVWIKDHEKYSKNPALIPAITAGIVLALAVFLVVEPQWLPPMVVNNTFTVTAVTVNILAGILFFTGAAALFRRHRQNTGDHEEIVLTSFCMLNGLAAVLFPFSPAWSAWWWFWHLLRAFAYILLLALIYTIYRSRELQADEALVESEAKYSRFFRTSMDCVFITSKDGHLIDFNDAAGELFGYSNREELMQVKIQDIYVNAEDRVKHTRIVAERGFTREFPVDLHKKDGSVLHTLITSVARYDPEGNVVGFQGTIRDITDRKRAEDALRESEARLHSIVHGSPMLQFVIDKNHRVFSWNRAIEEYSGIKSTDIVGTRDTWKAFYDTERPVLADLLVDEQVESLPEWYQGKFQKSRIVDGAYEATDFFPKMGASGTWLYFTAAPIRNDNGVIIGAVETLEDITERKLAEEALRLANRKLNLLSSITRHDINNQLMALNAYIYLSKDAVDNPAELKTFFAKEQRIADALANLISFTKDYEDLGMTAPVWQDVSVLIRNAAAILPMGKIELDIGCPGLEVYADPLLKKVFYNLIDNALHYGGDTMTTIRVTAGESEDVLLIIFEDDGKGIRDECKKQLFTKGFGHHTGLGLFLSREILSITGITITETGTPWKGARFEYRLPKGEYRFTGNL